MSSHLNLAPKPHRTIRMPLEIVLDILELAAIACINLHPRWTASLQLVSRAAQTAIEPIVYRMFIVEVSEGYDSNRQWGPIPEAVRLVQILANDAPRIHHLILGEHALNAVIALPIPPRSVPRLSIVTYANFGTPRPYLANPLNITSPNTELIHLGSLRHDFQVCFLWPPWTRARFWWSTSKWTEYEFLVTDTREMHKNRSAMVETGERWFYLEVDGEFMNLTTRRLGDIARILRTRDPKVHVVIVCPVDYTSPWGLKVDETIHLLDASRILPGPDPMLEKRWCTGRHMSVPLNHHEFNDLRGSRVDPHVLYSRVHISHAQWGFYEEGWPGLCYSRALQRGDDWDQGRLLRRSVAPVSM